MSGPLTFRTNLNCNACVAAVKPYLDRESSIASWEVDIAARDKTLIVHGESVSGEAVRNAVAMAGFKVLGELPESLTPTNQRHEEGATTTYYPLILIVTFLVGVVALVELAAGSFIWERAMRNFMGGFFLTFSFFKLLDLRGFADSFQMYDIVAQKWRAYAYAYPFIELLLGSAYLTGFQPGFTNVVTLLVMLVSAVGVLKSLLAKRKIRCACLGTVFNLPMSTVTLVEDSLMAAMAAVMLFVSSHGMIDSRHDAYHPVGSRQKTHLSHIHESHSHNKDAGLWGLVEREQSSRDRSCSVRLGLAAAQPEASLGV